MISRFLKYEVRVELYDVVQEKRDQICNVANQHGIQSVRVFGTAAWLGDEPPDDLNLLLEFEEGRSIFDLNL